LIEAIGLKVTLKKNFKTKITDVADLLSANKNTISFIVEDSGKGIPKNLRQKAIKPFERLDTSRNQNEGSSAGLGLAIVSDIARSHGGKLILGHSNNLGGLKAEIQIPL
jgi:two-component system osmolarity sensor histidine kinase EnvZ